jgi:hypothetical protein
VGGQTSATLDHQKDRLHVSGNIAPARGQLGWASLVLMLDAQGLAQDASAYTGIEIRLKLSSGMLSVSANSTDITNFDYHSTQVFTKSDDKFHTVRLPFENMKRAWSAQTPLNTKTLNAISIIAFGLEPGEFSYTLEHVTFY